MKKIIKRSEVKLGEEFEWGGGRYMHIEPHVKYGIENHINDTLILRGPGAGIKGQTTKWLDNDVNVRVERPLTFKEVKPGEIFYNTNTSEGFKYVKLAQLNRAWNVKLGQVVCFGDNEEVSYE